ncbi:uncharacterized protein N0V89_008089 [Didymosphaeria variabile]|uniref:Uncharacterized protein n=1 Tax=Didymosphaeria variabile TaxID=1932322 RepID=A0A9W9C891_9PLEO|nr:uncharacterized protein N0V89_008089 [Didymosphaeria variabile]KAJ4349474.1 hypothetical protein N0V89_008089 [Didymosphaeria variabile]
MSQITVERNVKRSNLLLLPPPPELREKIWNQLSRQSLVDASKTCNEIREDCAKQLCEQVGRGYTRGGLAYYHKFRKSTRTLYLERKVMNSPKALALVFSMYRDVKLRHVLVLDNSMWSTEACKPLKDFLGAQDELQTACVPVVGSANVPAVLNSIISISISDDKQKRNLSIVLNRSSDLDIVKRLIEGPGREVTDITLFGNQLQGATIESWAATLQHQGLVSPCNVLKLWLHFCDLSGLSRHLDRDVVESIGVFNCAYNAPSAEAMNEFLSDLLDHKDASKSTKLKEFVHTNFIENRDADQAYGITDAVLWKLAQTVTDVVAFTVQKNTSSYLELTQVIDRWSETLRVLAWNMKGKPLGFDTIRRLGITTPKLEALGLASHLSEAIMASTFYDETTRAKVHNITKELGEAIMDGGGLKHLHTLLFFFPELPMNHSFLSTLLETLTDVVTILKTYEMLHVTIRNAAYPYGVYSSHTMRIPQTFSWRISSGPSLFFIEEAKLLPQEHKVMFQLGGCSETRVHQAQARLEGPEKPQREPQKELRKISNENVKRRLEEELDEKRERKCVRDGNKKNQDGSKHGRRPGRK